MYLHNNLHIFGKVPMQEILIRIVIFFLKITLFTCSALPWISSVFSRLAEVKFLIQTGLAQTKACVLGGTKLPRHLVWICGSIASALLFWEKKKLYPNMLYRVKFGVSLGFNSSLVVCSVFLSSWILSTSALYSLSLTFLYLHLSFSPLRSFCHLHVKKWNH